MLGSAPQAQESMNGLVMTVKNLRFSLQV